MIAEDVGCPGHGPDADVIAADVDERRPLTRQEGPPRRVLARGLRGLLAWRFRAVGRRRDRGRGDSRWPVLRARRRVGPVRQPRGKHVVTVRGQAGEDDRAAVRGDVRPHRSAGGIEHDVRPRIRRCVPGAADRIELEPPVLAVGGEQHGAPVRRPRRRDVPAARRQHPFGAVGGRDLDDDRQGPDALSDGGDHRAVRRPPR